MVHASPAPRSSRFHESFWCGSALLAAAVFLAYANGMHGSFVFDDQLSIVENASLHHLRTAWRPPTQNGITVAGRPLLNLSFAANYALSGLAVWSYHATNVLVHLGAALLLLSVLRRTLASPASAEATNPKAAARAGAAIQPRGNGIALATALLWAVHPVQTESVAYLVQRAESLCGLLLLATLACFIQSVSAPTHPRRWQAGAFLACVAGMLTKETMAIAPLLVAGYDRVYVASSWRDVWRRRSRFHLALAATWLIPVAAVIATGGRGGTFALGSVSAWWRYDLTQFIAVVHYVRLLFWPSPLVIDYGTFWVNSMLRVLPDVVIVFALIGAAIVALTRCPRIGFVAGAFFLLLAPSSLPPGTIQMIVEHRLYLPLAAPLLLLVLGIDRLLGRRGVLAFAGAGCAFALLTAQRNTDYASPVRLFTQTVAARPHNARAMALLADYHRRAGRLAVARQWLERSLAAEPDVVPVLNNLGTVWQELGNPAQAVACFQRAEALDPRNVTTLTNLGNALVLAGRGDAGVQALRRAVTAAPANAAVHANLASALAQAGRNSAAADEFERALQLQPRDADAHANYASVLQALNRPTEAIEQLQAAIQFRSSDAVLHDRLGVALGRSGNLRGALAEFEAALRLDPGDETARRNVEIARRRLGE